MRNNRRYLSDKKIAIVTGMITSFVAILTTRQFLKLGFSYTFATHNALSHSVFWGIIIGNILKSSAVIVNTPEVNNLSNIIYSSLIGGILGSIGESLSYNIEKDLEEESFVKLLLQIVAVSITTLLSAGASYSRYRFYNAPAPQSVSLNTDDEEMASINTL